jgi:ATP-dependent DNA helicase DinG
VTPREILSDAGPLRHLIPGYAARPQQIEMAEAIAEALGDGRSLICEAGTGTGKTFAYLVPALLSGCRVIVSTGTRHLQDQLHGRDLPLVRAAVGVAINVALLKGRANYLCLLRLQQLERDTRGLDRQAITQLGVLRVWSQQTGSGDLAEVPSLPEEDRLRPLLTSTTENCLGQSCDFFDRCFVFDARRRAAAADLVVVNHHLYLADMGLRGVGHGELLPPADAVIFDEAHLLPDLASQFFSRTLTSHQWFEFVRDCRAALVEEAADLPDLPVALDVLEKAVRDLRLSFGAADGTLHWPDISGRENVAAAVQQFGSVAAVVHEMLEAFAQRGKLLDHCCRRLGGLLDMLEPFSERSDPDRVQWLEIRGRGFLLHSTPLEVSGAFREAVASAGCACIFTSATLSLGGDFTHFASRLGLEDVSSRSWPSPFDFRRQALLYVPPDLPDPRADGYTEQLIERALPVLALTGGRAFLLFTSYRALNIAAERMRAAAGYTVLVQGDAPRTELLEAFRVADRAVLLGTGSFWEGVDVRGPALSCVVIDKLPFASPDDPVLQARLRKMEEEHRNPFMSYQVPEAVIVLRQGIGRLIRDASDHGVLMIGDPRLLKKSYGRIFLNSLPDMERTRDLADVERFLRMKKV